MSVTNIIWSDIQCIEYPLAWCLVFNFIIVSNNQFTFVTVCTLPIIGSIQVF